MVESMIETHGGRINHQMVDIEELRKVTPIEQETDTYSPLHHYDFAMNTARLGQEMLGPHGFQLNGAEYAITPNGAQLFMVQAFDHVDRQDLQFSVAGRNSTDKSLLAAVAMGARVFCCMNLAISGRISIVRKHTGDIYQYLQDSLILAFHKATDSWSDLQTDVAQMKDIGVSDDEAFRLIGQMWGRKILLPQQMTQVRQRWEKPEQDEFEPRNYWSLYNAVTDVYKGLKPGVTMQRHLKLHEFTRDHVLFSERDESRITGLQKDLGIDSRTGKVGVHTEDVPLNYDVP